MAENMAKHMFKILKTIPGTNSNNPKITENKQSGHIAHFHLRSHYFVLNT
jgi:hypothetical protein